jgi:signal transduction histidine kinase
MVTGRPGEPVVDLRDAEVLATLADQAAPAIAALQLHRQPQQSRESLVLAREEERLRLRRDLHDGLGATLAGLRLQVESAQALAGDTAAGPILEAAGRGVTSAVAEVRGITDSLRPPAIDEIGLGSALTLLAERIRTPDLHVSAQVSSDVLGADVTIGAAAEVAAYRIASEALANVARHSGARAAVLSLFVSNDSSAGGRRLVLEVADNGCGLPAAGPAPTSGSGLGLAAMRQRAEEIGGTLEVISPADPSRRPELGGRGGTLVRAVLPLQEHPTEEGG